MSFLNPLMLWGAFGVSVPIAIHLLNRYRYKVVDWGAMELLRRAIVVRSRRVRLEDIILMALRSLIVLFVVLAMARPSITSTGSSWIGQRNDVGVVVAIDTSFSMDHKAGLTTRYEQAIDRAREVFKTIKPGTPTTLLFLGDQPHSGFRNRGFDAESLEKLLVATRPFPERLNLEMSIDELQKAVEEIKAPAHECFLITDAQALNWEKISDKSRQSLNRLADNAHIFLLPLDAAECENLTVTRFECATGLRTKDGSARCTVEVKNNGRQTRNGGNVKLELNDEQIDHQPLGDIRPGEKKTVSLIANFKEEGIARLVARIDDEALTTDNQRYLVTKVRATTRVLYVNPLNEPPPGQKDNVLLALAPSTELGRAGETDPYTHLNVERTTGLGFASRLLSEYGTIVLANIPDLDEDQARKLCQYVRHGGKLIVLLGENAQPDLLNERLQLDGVPLLPGKLTSNDAVVEAPDKNGWSIELVDHPLSAILKAVSDETLHEAVVKRRVRFTLVDGARAALQVGDKEPILAEKAFGRGHVVMFGMPADRDWTNIAVKPAFYPMLLNEAIGFLNRETFEKPVLVSQPLSVQLPPKDEHSTESVSFRLPDGRYVHVTPMEQEGLRFARLPLVVEKPGFYELRCSDSEGADKIVVAANVDPDEGDVKTLSADKLREALQDVKVQLIDTGDEVTSTVKKSRFGRELWREFLLAALVLLAVELVLAWWFTARQRAVV